MFRVAEPASTSTRLPLRDPAASAPMISSSVSSSSSRYFIIRASSDSAAYSIISSRAASAAERSAAGMSLSSPFGPRYAFMAMRSMMPLNVVNAPMGSVTGTNLASNLVRNWASVRSNEALSRSILLIKTMRGMAVSSAYCHCSSAPTSTPEAAQITMTAPSAARRPFLTSPTKSV